MAGNPYKFGSPEWAKYNEEEVAARPTALLNRKPLTPEEFESYRPKKSE